MRKRRRDDLYIRSVYESVRVYVRLRKNIKIIEELKERDIIKQRERERAAE